MAHPGMTMQEFLDVTDRVKFASSFATAPCLQQIATPADAGGCGRTFVGPNNFQGLPPTPVTEYDAEFTFGSGDRDLKQIPFTCASGAFSCLVLATRLQPPTPCAHRATWPAGQGAAAACTLLPERCEASGEPCSVCASLV